MYSIRKATDDIVAAAGSIVKPQATRLKTIEDNIEGILKSIASDHRVIGEKSSTFGLEGRISNIERLVSELKVEIDKKQEETRTVQSDEVTGKKEVRKDNDKQQDGNASTQTIRQTKKVKHSRIDLNNNENEVPLSLYYVFKFSEESRRSVNLYDIVDKVKEISGMHPKRVFGNNRNSVTVELCR